MNVLNLASATNALFAKTKTSISDFREAAGVKNVVVALRDNGDKVNGTLVLIGFQDNTGLSVGEVVNARNAQNKRPYGVHTVLAISTPERDLTDGTVDLSTVRAAAFLPA